MFRFKEYLEEAMEPRDLSISDLRKDEGRVSMFINKVRDGEKFATKKAGFEVIIDKDQLDSVTAFMKADNGFPAVRTKLTVKTNKGDLTVPNDFLKTGEFGGRGKGSGVAAETLAMNDFNVKLNAVLKKERDNYINLLINGRVVKVAEMQKTEGSYKGKEPKSDMSLVDPAGKPVAFISHKAGRTAKDYQQYGGISDKALPQKFKNNKEIKKFMQDVISQRPDGLQSGDSFYRPIRDKALVGMSMYGPEYGSRPSISNVDEFHLGNMDLKKAGDNYKITSVHKGSNGDMPKGQFTAVLFARFQNKRGDAKAAGEVLKNARVGIFPMAKTSSTSKKI